MKMKKSGCRENDCVDVMANVKRFFFIEINRILLKTDSNEMSSINSSSSIYQATLQKENDEEN